MAYFDKYGVEFSDDREILVKCPQKIRGDYVIPNSVTNIGGWAFYGCIGLTSVTIPNSVIIIGEEAFKGCISLTSIKIPNSVVNIGEEAFSDCQEVTSLDISNGVTSIGEGAFSGCVRLTSIKIPDSVTTIGDGAFYRCEGVTSISIGNGVRSLDGWPFFYCTSLKQIIVHSHNTVFDSRNNCNAIIETATNALIFGCQNTIIPDSVASIEYKAFKGCTGLISINLPNSITHIEKGVFDECQRLTSIIIPIGERERFEAMDGLEGFEEKLVEKDFEKVTILINLARAYELGIGVPQNIIQAILYFSQASEAGGVEAAYILGEWYHIGKYVPQDKHKALQYFQQAARYNYKDASTRAEQIQQELAMS